MHYRFYLLNGLGRFRGVIEQECSSDDAALIEATLAPGIHHGVEVWQGARRVGRVDRAELDEDEPVSPAIPPAWMHR